MIKFFQDVKYILILFLFLTVFTAISYVNLSQPIVVTKTPQELLRQETPMVTSVPTIIRTPASVDVKNKTEMLNADLFCQQPPRFKKTNQSLVMLNLNLCQKIKSQRHIWIKNETNGFKAQVFKIQENVYRTDFIQMSKGTNHLVIESVLKDGQKISQSLEIVSGI